MARTKTKTRRGTKLPSGDSPSPKNRQKVQFLTGPNGRRRRTRSIPATHLARLVDRERQKHIDETLQIMPTRSSMLPSWGPLLLAPVLLMLVAWFMLGLTRPSGFLELLRAGPALAIGISAVVGFATFGLAAVDLNVERPTEVLFKRTMDWLPGETTEQHIVRLRKNEIVDIGSCHPGQFPGQIISMRDAEDVARGKLPSLRNMADKDHPCVTLNLTESQRNDLRTGKRRIDPRTSGLVGVSLEDRQGAILPGLIEKYGSRAAVLVAEQEADIEAQEAKLDSKIEHEEHSFAREARLLRKALPRIITHTGAGLYFVKETPTLHNDTQSGAPAGQVITLTTGGIGTSDAFIGGYVSNTTRGEIRAIVSHTDGTVTLEGDLSTWADTDTLAVYDAWSTIQAAFDQLFTDQGTTTFTSSQYVRVFAGTYNEAVIPDPGLAPDRTNGFQLVLEGDPAVSRATVILSATTATALYFNADQMLVRHMTITCSDNSVTVRAFSGCFNFTVTDCVLEHTTASARVLQVYFGLDLSNCSLIQATVNGGVFVERGLGISVENCSFSGSSSDVAIDVSGSVYGPARSVISGTSISGFACGVRGSTVWAHNSCVANCTVYDCTTAFDIRAAANNTWTSLNNIVLDCTTVFGVSAWPEETASQLGPKVCMRNNDFYGYTNFADDGTTTKTHAEFIVFNRVDASGDILTDPLLADPGAGDFTPESNSKCIHRGIGAGVLYDVNGDPYDLHNPNIGAVASGPGPNVTYAG